MDQRGHHEPKNKFEGEYRQAVIEHIESYRPTVSHYTLEHAPNRRYLQASLDVTKMHTQFLERQVENNGEACSYNYYLGIFRTLNISFAYPCQDRCTRCTEHEERSERGEDDDDGFETHIRNATQARDAMYAAIREAKELPDRIVMTVDMQKVICMPKLDTKDYFFSRKLVLFNETFAPPAELAVQSKTKLIMWHEAEAGRKAYNIANAYLTFLKDDAAEAATVTFVTDNCNSQNKNWTLFSMLVRAVNDSSIRPHLITMLYLETGHTYMAADSVHGSIGTALKSKERIYDLQDYLSTILSSRSNMEATILDHSSQIIFTSNAKLRAGANVPIRDMKQVQFRRGSFSMYVKQDHMPDNRFTEIDFLKREAKRTLMRHGEQPGICNLNYRTETEPRGITAAKKADLLKLCQSMPDERCAFYRNLQINTTVDDLTETI